MADIVQSSEDLVILETDGGATLLETNTGGSTGPKGDTGAAGAAGISITWKNTWSSATAYSVNDAVHRDIASGGSGKAYICIQAHTNKDPDSGANSAFWSVLVERAASGLVLGPYETSRTLGFVATQAMTIYDENIKPANSYTVDSRKKNGSSVSLPVTLAAGDIYELALSNPNGRVYAGYSVR